MTVEVLFQPTRLFFIFLALFGRPPEFCRILCRLLARHFPLFLLGKAAKIDDLGHFYRGFNLRWVDAWSEWSSYVRHNLATEMGQVIRVPDGGLFRRGNLKVKKGTI